MNPERRSDEIEDGYSRQDSMGTRDVVADKVALGLGSSDNLAFVEAKDSDTADWIRKWAEGFGSLSNSSCPFGYHLDDKFYDETELSLAIDGKTSEEAKRIEKNNYEIMVRNQEKIDELNKKFRDL